MLTPVNVVPQMVAGGAGIAMGSFITPRDGNTTGPRIALRPGNQVTLCTLSPSLKFSLKLQMFSL